MDQPKKLPIADNNGHADESPAVTTKVHAITKRERNDASTIAADIVRNLNTGMNTLSDPKDIALVMLALAVRNYECLLAAMKYDQGN